MLQKHMETSPSACEDNTQIQVKILWEVWAEDWLPLPGEFLTSKEFGDSVTWCEVDLAFISLIQILHLRYISGILWSCWPERDNVPRTLERTLSWVLPETERGHSVVPSELHLEAELFKPVTPADGPSQNEEL